MNGPTKNRLSSYVADWIRLLVTMGIASKQDAWQATYRAAQRSIAEMHEQWAAQEQRRRRDTE